MTSRRLHHGERTYDVVVVGAGVVGAVLAKVLAERAYSEGRSISIAILEAGRSAGESEASHRAYVDRFYSATIKTPNSPYPGTANAAAPEDLPFLKPPNELYFKHTTRTEFGSTNTRALGGTTLHWMGIALRMMPSDFSMSKLYGHGEDWPIGYAELRPYYEQAEWELGVSASRADQLKVPGTEPGDFGDYEYPMLGVPTSFLDKSLDRLLGPDFHVHLAGADYPARLVPLPQARNSIPNANAIDPRTYIASHRRSQPYRNYGAPDDPVTGPGQRCQGNANCIPICPAQAKYTALKTVQQLRELDRLPGISIEIMTKTVATKVRADEAGRISCIDYHHYDSEELAYTRHGQIIGRRFVLACSAIENARLLLASRNEKFTAGIANTSDCVGRYLMDHPFVLAWGLSPEGAPFGSFRGPGATSDIPLRDGKFRKSHAAFRTDVGNWGWGLTDDAPSQDLERLIDPDSFRSEYVGKAKDSLLGPKPLFGARLRSSLHEIVPRQVTLGFLTEQLPESQNRVTIEDDWKDQLGVHKPVISYSIGNYTRAGIAAAYGVAAEVFKKAGIADFTDHEGGIGQTVEYDKSKYKFIGAGHIMGTHRMGKCPQDSVVNSYQRSWDHENLYVAGCGSMPTTGTSNPTLTAVALSIRTAEEIYRGLDLA